MAPQRTAVGLLPYLPHVKFWNPCTESFAPYYYSAKELAACDQLPPEKAVEKTRLYFGELNKKLFLFEKPLRSEQDQDYFYQKIFSVDRGIFGYMYEAFYLYRPVRKVSMEDFYDKALGQKDTRGFLGKTFRKT
ncbi:MAG: hypothetical protein PHU49_16755 [Syntrophorhabdaceae bacterium]|nr:hypothetical protein [Syntrophorhabdaceae bacterium]